MTCARFVATLERAEARGPVVAAVPSHVAERLSFSGAACDVEVALRGHDIGQRTVRPSEGGRWLMEVDQAACARLGLGPGDTLVVALRLLPPAPLELAGALAARGHQADWDRLPVSVRRAIGASILAADEATTRCARIERALALIERHRQALRRQV